MTLQLVRVRIENVMGLRSADYTPGAGGNVLYGQNGSGKSSMHAAIRAAFKGLPVEMITRGEDHAEVMLRLRGPDQEFQVLRRRTADSQEVEVRPVIAGKIGGKLPTPAKVLSGFLGDFSLDPAAFAMAAPADQVELFCRAFPVSLEGDGVEEIAKRYHVDLDRNGFVALQMIEEYLEADRLAAGQEKRKAEAVAEEHRPADITIVAPTPEAVKAAEERWADARGAAQSIAQQNAAIDARNTNRTRLASQRDLTAKNLTFRLSEIDAEIVEHERKIASLRDARVSALEKAESTALELTEKIDAAGNAEAHVSAASVAAAEHDAATALGTIRTLQSAAANVDLYHEKLEEVSRREKQWAVLNETINDKVRGQWMRVLWRQIPSTIPGLAIGRDKDGKNILTLDGIPMEQINTAAKIQVGVRSAAALNAEYPVKMLAVDDAEHLTPKNRTALIEYAEREGFQVLLMVAADREDVPEGGIVIHEGKVETV